MLLYGFDKKDYNHSIVPLENYIVQNQNMIYQRLTFNSPHNSKNTKNNTVICDIILNKDSVFPGRKTFILIHGFMSKQKKLYNYYSFMEKIASRGVNVVLLHLPYHLERKPVDEKSGRRLIGFDDVETLDFFHQSVVDIKRLIDIINRLEPGGKINICGLSLGSLVAIIAKACDARINKCIALLGGGCWENIHWNGIMRLVLKNNCLDEGEITHALCKKFYSGFPSFVEEFEKTDLNNLTFDMENNPSLREKVIKKCFLCDPLAFASRIKPGDVFMINSRFDHYFSKKSTIMLWEKLKRPEIHWLNTLHSSYVLKNYRVFRLITNFIDGQ